MKDNLTFTGINNVYIGRKIYSRIGSYVDNMGEIKQGKKNYKEILIRCNLADDKYGKDFTDFVQSLDKCNGSYQAMCIPRKSDEPISLLVKRCVAGDAEKITNSNFVLNGISIMPNDRRVLPLFSYLAHLTKKIAGLVQTSENQAKVLKTANKSIHEEAVKFIDNMVLTPSNH